MLYVSAVHSFILPSSIPLYGCAASCLSDHLLMTFGLFLFFCCCKSLGFVYKSLYGHVLSFLLGKYIGVEWLDHCWCMLIKKKYCFPKWLQHFTFPPVVFESSGC